MRILHTVEFYHPSRGGTQEVVRQLSEHLARFGHDVTVATTTHPERAGATLNGVTIRQFNISGNEVRGYAGETAQYQQFLRRTRFDVITNFAAQQWATDLAFSVLDDIHAKKVLVPTGFSGLYWPQYRQYFARMPERMSAYDINIFLSRRYRDIDFARQHRITNFTVIPNGADEREFIPPSPVDIRQLLGIPADHFLAYHVGSHTNAKGHRETMEIFAKANIRKATLLLAGNVIDAHLGCLPRCRARAAAFTLSPRSFLNRKRIMVASLPREQVVAAFKAADLFLFPSNIECSPLVLFEAMAARTPFLTTDVGNAAEIIEWSRAGRLLPSVMDAEGFTRALIEPSVHMLEELYHDRPARHTMAEAGFRAWREKFTWTTIARTYETVYRSLLRKEATSSYAAAVIAHTPLKHGGR